MRQFRRLVRMVAERGGPAVADGRPGRRWALPLADRVLLVVVYWRTNLTLRQVGPLFGISHAAAHRVVDTVGPLPALQPVKWRGREQVCIVDGTLVPLRDRRLAARSKNYRYSANVQIVIGADTRLVVAVGDPVPGNAGDCQAYRDSGIDRALAGRHVMADGAYRGNPGVIISYRRGRDGAVLAAWQEDLNAVHRGVRARIEHTMAHLKVWKILRDHRRRARTLRDTVAGIAYLHNLRPHRLNCTASTRPVGAL
ncbi:transposase family protein [Thermomonospora amylolytica]|uniref:transposase family protein n=1 Tax=Thermomonospora amylolytica TaxID=1411117 RepID=UPI000E6C8B9E|nr:transposase family protein [Thermomonospora amylolytica]